MSDYLNINEFFISYDVSDENRVKKTVYVPLNRVEYFTINLIQFIDKRQTEEISNIKLLSIADLKRVLEIENAKVRDSR
jgi:hypothetical protein